MPLPTYSIEGMHGAEMLTVGVAKPYTFRPWQSMNPKSRLQFDCITFNSTFNDMKLNLPSHFATRLPLDLPFTLVMRITSIGGSTNAIKPTVCSRDAIYFSQNLATCQPIVLRMPWMAHVPGVAYVCHTQYCSVQWRLCAWLKWMGDRVAIECQSDLAKWVYGHWK